MHFHGLVRNDPQHQTTKWPVRKAKTQISLGIQSSLSEWRKFRSLATHTAHNEDSDQTGRMSWVFAARICRFVCFVVLRLKCNMSCVVIHYTHSLISRKVFNIGGVAGGGAGGIGGPQTIFKIIGRRRGGKGGGAGPCWASPHCSYAYVASKLKKVDRPVWFWPARTSLKTDNVAP